MLDAATIDGAGGEPEPVPGAFSMLDRTAQRIATKVRTRARAGHAYTLWYVIFNAPKSCSDGLCGDDDVFTDPSDHSAGPNAPQIAATRASVVWAGAGAVANPAGGLTLDGGLGTGEVPAGPGQVVIGRGENGALVPLGVTIGLEDPGRAVILGVIQDHGAAHDDPELLEQQLTSFRGACNPNRGMLRWQRQRRGSRPTCSRPAGSTWPTQSGEPLGSVWPEPTISSGPEDPGSGEAGAAGRRALLMGGPHDGRCDGGAGNDAAARCETVRAVP